MTASRQVAGGAWAGTVGDTAPKAGLIAAGANQGNALLIQHEYAEVATCAAGAGVRLPAPSDIGGLQPGDRFVVPNLGANALLVYPPVGGKINAAAVNAGFSVAAGKVAVFYVSVASVLNWTAILSA